MEPSSSGSTTGTPDKTGAAGKRKIDWANLAETPDPKRVASDTAQAQQNKPPSECAVEVWPVTNKFGNFNFTFTQLDPRDLWTRFKDEWEAGKCVLKSEANQALEHQGYKLNKLGYGAGQ